MTFPRCNWFLPVLGESDAFDDNTKSLFLSVSRTIALVILFSQSLRNVKCPVPVYRIPPGETKRSVGVKRLDIFVLLPV